MTTLFLYLAAGILTGVSKSARFCNHTGTNHSSNCGSEKEQAHTHTFSGFVCQTEVGWKQLTRQIIDINHPAVCGKTVV